MNQKNEHFCKVAAPSFLNQIGQFTYDLAKWIQYTGCRVEAGRLVLQFRASSCDLHFNINTPCHADEADLEMMDFDVVEIYDFFKKLKFDNI